MTSEAAGAERSVQVNGLTMYVEAYGSGPPLVLLHGGLGSARRWEPYWPLLGRHYQLVAPDLRGHGRTDNPTGTFSYRLMADDIAALIQVLGLHQPAVCGYSDGGQVALELGMRYPALASALIVGGAFHRLSDDYRAGLRTLGFEAPGVVDVERLARAVPQLVPLFRTWHAPRHGPDYWQTLARQISTMWLTPLDYRPADWQAVTVPTLVVLGDRDQLIPVEQAVEMYRLLPHGELAVVPGADHLFPFVQVEYFAHIILAFLARHRGQAGQAGDEAGSARLPGSA